MPTKVVESEMPPVEEPIDITFWLQVGAFMGLGCVVLVDDTTSREERNRIRAYGAEVRGIPVRSTPEDRSALLEFGIDLIMSDDELTEDENRLVQQLSATWEVALQPLVARAMGIN